MGTCSAKQSEEGKQDNSIRKELEEEKLLKENVLKILLLGTGGVGKTTFVKALTLGMNKEMTRQQKSQFRLILRENVTECITDLFVKTALHGQEVPDKLYALLRDVKHMEERAMHEEEPRDFVHEWQNMSKSGSMVAKAIKVIRKMDIFSEVGDNCEYLFDNMERILDNDFEVTDEDILYARKQTTGVQTYKFDASHQGSSMNVEVIDVGGQRGERRKWIACFESEIRLLIYLASLNDYHQTLQEDKSVNRLVENVKLFETVNRMPWFSETPMLLFLNKYDLLEKNIRKRKLEKVFSKYKQFAKTSSDRKDPNIAYGFIQHVYQTVIAKVHDCQIKETDKYCQIVKTSAVQTGLMLSIWQRLICMTLSKNLEGFE